MFGLILSLPSNRQFQVVLNGKSSQEYPVNAGVPQGSALGRTRCLLYINDVTSNAIFNITIYANVLISIRSGRLQIQSVFNMNSTCIQLELEYTVDWGRSGVLISILKKNSTGSI